WKAARSFAYDLLRWREWWVPVSRGGKVPDGAPRRQPVSMPTHLTAAMNVAVRLILEEGLSHRFRRHEVAATALRRGVAAMGIEMFPDPSIVSNTVSCLKVPKPIDPAAVVTQMRDPYGIPGVRWDGAASSLSPGGAGVAGADGMRSDKRTGAGPHLGSGHPPKVPTPLSAHGMKRDMRNGAEPHLVSGHPPTVPAPLS